MLPLPVPTQRRLHDNSSDVTRDNTFLSVAVIYMFYRFIHKKQENSDTLNSMDYQHLDYNHCSIVFERSHQYHSGIHYNPIFSIKAITVSKYPNIQM